MQSDSHILKAEFDPTVRTYWLISDILLCVVTIVGIPLEKITDMALVQGPVIRHFNIYKLTVETAGQSAPGALVALIGIVDAKKFREAVSAQRDQVSERSDSGLATG